MGIQEKFASSSKALKIGVPGSIQAQPPKKGKTTRRWSVYRFDNSAIASGDKTERAEFAEAARFLLGYFPKEERVQLKSLFRAAERSASKTFGNGPDNRYALLKVEDGGRLVGAASVRYLDAPQAIFVGYIRVAEDYQRCRVAAALGNAAVEFGEESAKAAGKKLLARVGEMEPIPLSPNKGEAEKRYRWSMRRGAKMVDPTTGFSYTQSGLPLNLVYTPLSDPDKSHLSRDELRTLVEAMYYTGYSSLFRTDPAEDPESEIRKVKSARKHLDSIIASIPEGGVRLVDDLLRYGRFLPGKKSPAKPPYQSF